MTPPDHLDPCFIALTQSAGLAVLVLDRDRRVVFANERAAEALQRRVDEPTGRRFDQLIPVAGPEIDGVVARVLETGSPVFRYGLGTDWGQVAFDVIPAPGPRGVEHVVVVLDSAERAVACSGGDAVRARQTMIDISSRLARMSIDEADEVLSEALARIAREYQVDRAYVRLLSEDGRRFEVTHHYDAPGLEPLPLDAGSELHARVGVIEKYRRGETIVIESLDQIGPEERPLRRILEAIGCRSGCGVPIVDGPRLLGRIAFATVREREWPEVATARLRVFGEMFAAALGRVRADRALRERLEFEQALATVSARLIDVAPSSIDEELQAALEGIARALRMDCTVLAQLDAARERFVISHEWCAAGVSSFRAAMTGLPIARFGWPQTALARGELVSFTRDEVPEDAPALRSVIERTGVRTMVAVPLSVDGDVIGSVLFQSMTRASRVPEEIIPRLRFASDAIASALARRRADESLRESESRFAHVIECAPDGVVVLGPDGAILEWTAQSERIFGRRREEVLGCAFADVALDPVDAPRFTLAQEGRFELTGVRGGCRPFPLEISTARMKRRGETILACFVRDITERKRTEADRQRAFEEVARQKTRAEHERDYLREESRRAAAGRTVIGRSAAFRRAMESLDAVASTSATVLVVGESGVGKELFARALHERSRRAQAPLVKVNCASIPESLFESEFFGHVRGSFTGAHKDRIGRFELADGGTLFLDEVGEIPLDMQAKLLRVLQEGEFERVGDDRTRRVDVRIVAATNRDLAAEVQAERFRRDLFYRLSVFPIGVPPLRDRREDIVPLASHFLAILARAAGRTGLTLSQAQEAALLDYDWPGNVRELEHVIERAVILSPAPPLRLELALSSPTRPSSSPPPSRSTTPSGIVLRAEDVRRIEKESIVAALERARGRISGAGGAAELLGVKPSTLRDRMKALGVTRRA